MDDVDVSEHPRHDQVAEHRLLEPLVLGILEGEFELGVDPPDRQVSFADVLIAETDDGDLVGSVVDAGQLPGEVLDVNSCAAINVWRVFVGQDRNPHSGPPASVTIRSGGPPSPRPDIDAQGSVTRKDPVCRLRGARLEVNDSMASTAIVIARLPCFMTGACEDAL